MRKNRQRRRARTPAPALPQEQEYAGQLNRIRQMARQLKPHVSPEKAQELEGMLDKVGEIAAYEAMQDEIEAAGHALEVHRTEFEQMMRDLGPAMDRAYQLFSEEQFASMRYTAADIHRAFEAVGYPARYREDLGEEDMDILFAASLYLADDEELRFHLARQLVMALPEYVSAGRYLDGWLIQYSAFQMTEAPDKNNPFLFVMFNLALEEWARQVDDQQEAMLREMGVDRAALSDMSIEEADAWFRAQMADPAQKTRLEAYYAAHPMMRAQAEAEMMELEGNALSLLERADAECLYLSPEEMKDWLPVLVERLDPLKALAQQAPEQGEQPDPDIMEAVQKIFVDATVEMAAEIFSPERIAQLAAALRDYRDRLHAAGEREAAAYAHGALISLTREDLPPAENRFLAAVCLASLVALSGERATPANTQVEDGPGDEEVKNGQLG
jgi:cell fate (sporulation/competence/biofilm development) regulator YlbF (YheA/YmcA/DUF963 family)